MTVAQPLARYGAMWKARVAGGFASLELHHVQGHDRGPSRRYRSSLNASRTSNRIITKTVKYHQACDNQTPYDLGGNNPC